MLVEAPPQRTSPEAPPSRCNSISRLLTFRTALAFGLLVVTIFTFRSRFNDPDLWWHLKVGEVVWNTGKAPSTDVFSFTTNHHAWTAHEWLAQLAIFTAYRAGGYTGLLLFAAVLAWLIFTLTYVRCCNRRTDPLLSLAGGLTAWFFATVGLAVRPHMLGYFLLALELLLLDLGRNRSRRWLWLLPPIFALWVNCHGSYLFGLGVLAAHWISGCTGRFVSLSPAALKPKVPGAIVVLSTAALLCNPQGFGPLVYPFDVRLHQSTSMNFIQEWLPLSLDEPCAMGILLCLGLLAALALNSGGSRMTLDELLVVGAAVLLAVRHSRMAFVFGIVVPPVLCRLVARRLRWKERPQWPLANAVLILSGLALAVAAFPGKADLERQVRAGSPAGAVEYLRRAGLKGPMLNDYAFGGYLIWALPDQKVFIDGRGDIFDWTGVMSAYRRWALLQEDPRLLLDRYAIRLCLLQTGSAPAQVLPYLPGWRRVYQDDVGVVFIR